MDNWSTSTAMEQGMPMSMMGQGMPMMPSDPHSRGQMLQMRGEIMRATGDILIKYGKQMTQEEQEENE
ncbi:hypothetical protein GF339_05695 [candidate division KSB3 bacterium]|uniref:Uncharacterized protein n=1 Tax=candidate division KSB3 bacterium TaxID=2044937 RepID=A0A9D5Q5A9_9BACT|nr:hypothetical protein [candidate division KSB3 bacterium]MBD3324057.1 hypothetical protein [candidate division KSB3 bacterium]